jgi:hypothetical protein
MRSLRGPAARRIRGIALTVAPVTVLLILAGAVPRLVASALIGLLRAHGNAAAELARRRAAEESLRALNDSLEQRVAQSTAGLWPRCSRWRVSARWRARNFVGGPWPTPSPHCHHGVG